ncbi:MAG: hypothetical protein VKJ64_06290 [Leptolyngbyaceae bacterium]|nr:hypothetical protein [Leptolyngbyaceae bacterium]
MKAIATNDAVGQDFIFLFSPVVQSFLQIVEQCLGAKKIFDVGVETITTTKSGAESQ